MNPLYEECMELWSWEELETDEHSMHRDEHGAGPIYYGRHKGKWVMSFYQYPDSSYNYFCIVVDRQTLQIYADATQHGYPTEDHLKHGTPEKVRSFLREYPRS